MGGLRRRRGEAPPHAGDRRNDRQVVDGRRLCRGPVHHLSGGNGQSERTGGWPAAGGVRGRVRRRFLLVRRLLPVLAGLAAADRAGDRRPPVSGHFIRVPLTSDSGRYLPSGPAYSATAV